MHPVAGLSALHDGCHSVSVTHLLCPKRRLRQCHRDISVLGRIAYKHAEKRLESNDLQQWELEVLLGTVKTPMQTAETACISTKGGALDFPH